VTGEENDLTEPLLKEE